jgi:uncharacterized membrane protein (DUF106 family)
MSTTFDVRGFMGGIVYIGYNLCRGLYDIIKYGFEKESNFVCVVLSITILASIIADILSHIQYEQLNTNKQRIQELEKKVYHIENKLDDTRMVALHLQRVFDYEQKKEIMS